MLNSYTPLDVGVITSCYLFVSIALIICVLWILRLKSKIKEVERRLVSFTTKYENSYEFSDKEHTINSNS